MLNVGALVEILPRAEQSAAVAPQTLKTSVEPRIESTSAAADECSYRSRVLGRSPPFL